MIEARKAFSSRLGTDDAKLFNVSLTATELQQEADRWADLQYGETAHSALKGKTPNEVARAWTQPINSIENLSTLDVLLAPVAGQNGIRRVTNQGIRIAGEFYYTGDVMPGRDVLVRHDPEDLGRDWLFEPDGEVYLGDAVNPDLAGLDPAATIQKVRAMQKKVEEDQLAEIRKQKRAITPRTVADAQRAAYQRNADVLSFPKLTEKHETKKIEAAAAVKAKRAPKPLSEAEKMVMEQLGSANTKPANVQPSNQRETPEDRLERAMRFETRIAEGNPISEDDAVWLTGYQAGAEYRARNLLWKEQEKRSASVPPAS